MEQGIGLGASARVRRGFNRAGVALAALVAIIGLCAAFWGAVDKLDREYAFRVQAECLKPKLDKLYSTLPKGFALEQIRTSEHGCPGPESVTTHFLVDAIAALSWSEQRQNILFSYAPAVGLALVLSFAAWILLAGLGWVLSGFFND